MGELKIQNLGRRPEVGGKDAQSECLFASVCMSVQRECMFVSSCVSVQGECMFASV